MPDHPAPNVLFFGFRRPLNQQALRRALAGCRVGKVGLISRENFLGPKAEFFLSARHGFRHCDFDGNTFQAFPSGSFLRRQQSSEVVVLRMFERIYRRLSSGQSYERRKRLYLEQVAYVYGLLQDGGYDTVILSDIPHNPFGYLLLSVARGLGKRTHFFFQIQVKDTFIIAPDVEGMFEPIRSEYARLRASGEPVSLTGRMRREFDRRSGKHEPFYMSLGGLPWRRKAYEWSKRIFRVDDRFRWHRTLANGLAYWRVRRRPPAPEVPFVYFPLHLQPEATTSPMGGVFVDQYLAVEMLARALPSGWALVIKENPVQRFAKRDLGFYQRLGRMRDVHLVSRSANTFELTERCRAVATITGTAGWEALFLQKPAVVFGNAFYRGAPGTANVDDPRELAADLRAIADGRFPLCTPDDLTRFLVAIEHCSAEGVVDTQYLRDSDLPEAECVERYAAALARLIERPSLT
jgi:hypothetical protein